MSTAKLPKEEVTPVTEAIENWVDGVTSSLQKLSAVSQRAVSDATRLYQPDTSPETAFYNAAKVWSTWARKIGKMAADLADGLALLAANDGPTVLLSIDPLVLPAIATDGEYWFELDSANPLKWSAGPLDATTDPGAAPEAIEAAFVAVSDGRVITSAPGERLRYENGAWTDDVKLRIVVPRASNKPIPVGMVSGNIRLFLADVLGGVGSDVPFYGQLA